MLRDEVELALVNWLGHKDDVRPYLRARLRAMIAVCGLHKIDASKLTAQLAGYTKSTEEKAETN